MDFSTDILKERIKYMNELPLEGIRYSIPYLCLVLYFILLFFLELQVKRQETYLLRNILIIRFLAGAGLLLFFGFRGFIGWDWTIYFPAFKNTPELFSLHPDSFTVSRYEPAFIALMSFFKTISGNYHFFIFFNTLADIVVLLVFLKQFSKVSLSLSCLLFIVMGGIYLETDLLRNAKSIMLFLLSLRYLRDRQLLPYLMLNLLGCMFHFSSLIYIPLYFFLHKQISRKTIIIIFIIGILLYLLQIEYIRPLISKISGLFGQRASDATWKYLNNDLYSVGYGITIGFIERMITSSLILLYYHRLISDNRNNILFINSFVLYFIFFFYFAEIKIIPVRVGGLFYYSYWILIPSLLSVIIKRNNRILFLFYIFIYSLVKIAGMSDNILYKYRSVLFVRDNFEKRLEVFESTKDFFLR